jgi:hypothetical protein
MPECQRKTADRHHRQGGDKQLHAGRTGDPRGHPKIVAEPWQIVREKMESARYQGVFFCPQSFTSVTKV